MPYGDHPRKYMAGPSPRPMATSPQALGKPLVMLYASEPAGLMGGAGGAETGTRAALETTGKGYLSVRVTFSML